MNTAGMRSLTDAELDLSSGAAPNLGGYTYCWGQGLYVGGCPGDRWLDWFGGTDEAAGEKE